MQINDFLIIWLHLVLKNDYHAKSDSHPLKLTFQSYPWNLASSNSVRSFRHFNISSLAGFGGLVHSQMMYAANFLISICTSTSVVVFEKSSK